MRNRENTAGEGSERGAFSSTIDSLRFSLAGRALQLLLLAAACTPGRAGTHQIEIKGSPEATARLEALRREFRRVSQLPRWDETAIQRILAERRNLLAQFGIDGNTETWINTDRGDGPQFQTEVNKAICTQAPKCQLVRLVRTTD